jgi:hypothetical protein
LCGGLREGLWTEGGDLEDRPALASELCVQRSAVVEFCSVRVCPV